MWHNTLLVLFEARRNTMRKTIITVFAFMVIFGFAVSGAMAQMVNWDPPALITNGPFLDIEVNPVSNQIEGFRQLNPTIITDTIQSSPTTSWVTGNGLSLSSPVVDSVVSPNGVTYVIDADTVGIWVSGDTYTAFPVTEQPKVPADEVDPLLPMVGAYRFIAAGPDGKLYILFEDTEDPGLGDQYLLVGNPAVATVRLTPRSLNQNSRGNWVTCKISGLPEGYAVGDINLDDVCVTGIDTDYTITPVCYSSGPSNNHNKKKVMLKFDRQELIGAIPDVTGTVEITVIGTVGEAALPFVGTDTIKTKAPKVPK